MSAIARRIARAHNDFRKVVLEQGTLVFSERAFSVEPTLAADETDLEHLPFPVADHEVTEAEVAAWLRKRRAYVRRERDRIEAALEARRERAAVRVMERERDHGHATGAVNCFSCGRFKSKPSAVCGYCGDDPVTHNGDRREFDRAYGRAA